MTRYTPENITALPDNAVFVFGSNLAGNHAAGAARTAVEHFGAIMGEGEGMQGQSYAIPTMDGDEVLAKAVRTFLELTGRHPELEFWVTKIGTGIAGYSENDIKPLFVDAPANVVLPRGWSKE